MYMAPSKQATMQHIGKYKKGGRLVDTLSDEAQLLNNMPTLWGDIVFADPTLRVKQTIDVWKAHFSHEYKSLISVFEAYLKDVFLIEYQEQYSLV